MPVLSFGTGTFGGSGERFKAFGTVDVAGATRVVDICLEAGLTTFDSADVYSAGQAEGLHSTAGDGPQVPGELLCKVVDASDEVAGETGTSVPQVALNRLLQRPTVATVIVGTRNEEPLQQNLGAVGWNLTREQIAKLDAASAVPKVYPYWHQMQFKDRNPFPTE